jgi:chromosome segregation ATPase
VPAKEEIQELKAAISNFKDALRNNKGQLTRLDGEYERFAEKRKAIESRIKLQQGNQEHLRRRADLVNLEELAGIARLIEAAEIELEKVLNDMSIIDRARLTIQGEIEQNEKNLGKARAMHAEYGQVIPFPGKTA